MQFTQEQLTEMLDKHAKWLRGDGGGERADFTGANLTEANLTGAVLSGANLTNVKNLPSFQIVPETGAFQGWKKLQGGYIALIEIPKNAGRVSSTGRKCRAEFVKVLLIYSPKGRKTTKPIGGHRDSKFMYQAGKTVRADKWDDDIRVECTHGIHFFLTRKEAEEY